MQEMQHASQEQPQSGGASKIVADIHSKMAELAEILDQSSAVDDSDKKMLQDLMAGYRQFVQALSAAPGQHPQQQQPKQMGPSPVEAGGSPNAVPSM